MAERLFTMTEVRETFFPGMSVEELEGELTEEQMDEELGRLVEMAQRNSAKPGSAKLPS